MQAGRGLRDPPLATLGDRASAPDPPGLPEQQQQLPNEVAPDSGDVSKPALSKEEREAALKKGALEETEEQIMFSCNICYDVSPASHFSLTFHGSRCSLQLASEPVVTLCGHLYCWPCLYRWLQVQSHCRTCPVCKAGVEKDKVHTVVLPLGSTVFKV